MKSVRTLMTFFALVLSTIIVCGCSEHATTFPASSPVVITLKSATPGLMLGSIQYRVPSALTMLESVCWIHGFYHYTWGSLAYAIGVFDEDVDRAIVALQRNSSILRGANVTFDESQRSKLKKPIGVLNTFIHKANPLIATEIRYPAGQVLGRGDMRGTARESRWTFYYRSGERAAELFYENDLLNGVQQAWFENGNLRARVEFKNGLRHGYCTFWEADKSVLCEGVFKNDLPEGRWAVNFNYGGSTNVRDDNPTHLKSGFYRDGVLVGY